MSGSRATPVIIGVADVVNRSTKIEDAREPLDLMSQAIRDAISDTALSSGNCETLRQSVDSIDVISSWTWPYPDLPGLVGDSLGVKPARKFYSDHGGNKPGKYLDEAARRISMGETKVAVLTGGEALASLTACAAAKKLPPPGWHETSQAVDSVFSPTTRELRDSLGARHEIGAPIHIYPLFENGYRAHRHQSIKENNRESAKLYADFAKVAETNPYAWNYGKAATEEVIGTVTKKNRMICFPYPLLMNAFNTINLAGAVILTSTDFAKQLNVPIHKWIYPLGGAGTQDSSDFWLRPNFHSSPSISRSIDASLQACGLTKDEVDLHDFYSCFPIVPKLAAHHLGLDLEDASKPVTLLGGLTSFGGAGNNYSMHAFTEMTRQLRKGKGRNGMVLANGGVATYQSVVCLSSQPRKSGSYPEKNPLPEYITDIPVPEIDDSAEGEAVIETYTVEFSRDGSPLRGHVVGRLKKNDHRFIANHADQSTLHQLCGFTEEPIGRAGYVRPDTEKEGRNLFSFGKEAKL